MRQLYSESSPRPRVTLLEWRRGDTFQVPDVGRKYGSVGGARHGCLLWIIVIAACLAVLVRL